MKYEDLIPTDEASLVEKYKKIFVLGGWAEKPQIMGGGSSIVHTKDEMIDSPLEEIKKLAGDEFEVVYNQCYCDVVKENLGATTLTARAAIADCTDDDIILCFISSVTAETEGLDRYSLHFENYIDNIIRRFTSISKNIVVIMQTGSAYVPYVWDRKVDGIVQMWLAGESAGKAIADVLFGKVNPSGKLAETFPNRLRTDFENISASMKNVNYKEGFEVGYRYYDNHTDEIWYPFGHGLSYTSFEYNNLSAKLDGENINISLDITNTGDVDGKEIVQIYFGRENSFYDRPVKELKGFEKVLVSAGKTEKVSVTIPVSDLAVYNVADSEWVVENGEYKIYVGASSQDIRLTADIEL